MKLCKIRLGNFWWLIDGNMNFEIVCSSLEMDWMAFYLFIYWCGTSWCSGRLVGSPRQRSRVQDPISTINIHEGSHWVSEPYTLWGSHALTNSAEFRHAKDVKTLELRAWINLNLDPSDKPSWHKMDVKWKKIYLLSKDLNDLH